MTTARVPLGHSGIHVRPIGLGCMGMSQFYGPADPAESIATIHTAIDVGIDFFDTSDIYGAADAVIGQTSNGFGHNEALLGRAVRGRRNEVVLATKFGSRPGDAGGVVMDGRPEYVAQACEASLARLGTDYIDLYYIHRLDPSVPVEGLVDELREFSTARGHTPGQVALAWLLAQPHDIVPIPGTKRVKYVRENAEATAVPLSVDDVAALADMFASERVRGGQYGNLDLRGRQESST